MYGSALTYIVCEPVPLNIGHSTPLAFDILYCQLYCLSVNHSCMFAEESPPVKLMVSPPYYELMKV